MPFNDLLTRNSFHNTEWIDDASGERVLLVKDPHALTMIAGYLKYTSAKADGEGVYYRGQQELYKSLCPSLYREIKTQKARSNREAQLNQLLQSVKRTAGIFNGLGPHVTEPLLQHYGIPTTWMDLVDNVWVALWFACNKAIISGKANEYLHFEERIPGVDGNLAYVLFIAADITSRNRMKPGYFYGEKTELVDLRMAAPSVFLRPHAQHGLLFRKHGIETGRPLDYSDQIRGAVAVDLSRALQWLGDGKMVSTHTLFPPPFYDHGYQILLNLDWGAFTSGWKVNHVGA